MRASEETSSAIESLVQDLHDSALLVFAFGPYRLSTTVRLQPVVRAEVLPHLEGKVLLRRPQLDWSLGVCYGMLLYDGEGCSSYGLEGTFIAHGGRLIKDGPGCFAH